MSRIRILAEAVANKIAAGEVVERPASVVKELLENSLDAGASSIWIETEMGGKRMIRVIDNGHGMAHDDALLAFERHATSKLRNADDLLSIATLGFRGEALPTIAAVSRLLLETRDGAEVEGTRIEYAGGKLVGVKPAALPAGTTISVADLFYSIPARRKFLKSDTTELGHIASLVTHYALANPGKQFILTTPTQEIINCAPVEKVADRVYQLFGKQSLDELLEIPVTSAAFRAAITEPEMEAREAATLTVSGFTSRPDIQRPNRNGIYVFVNRRLVRDRLILHAIHEGYRNILPPTVFPATLLFLEMPYDEVDVNVHPAKIEVRFRRSQFVHDFTRDAIRQALMSVRPIASFATAATAANALNPAPPPGTFAGGFGETNINSGVPRAVIPPIEELGVGSGVGSDYASGAGFDLTSAPMQPVPQRFTFEAGSSLSVVDSIARYRAARSVPNWAENLARPNGETPATLPRPDQIADLKPLGQVSSSFIIAVNGEGLWIIDQHVAHERVLFEQHLEARRAGKVESQRMLMPMVIELSPRQIVTYEKIAEELRANGFEVEPMGPKSVAIQSVPAGIAGNDEEGLLTEILDGIERENAAISIDTLQSKIAASTACHAAIKINMPLDQTKMEWLLGALAKTDCPMSCPHGRPVVLRYSLKEIEHAFHRI